MRNVNRQKLPGDKIAKKIKIGQTDNHSTLHITAQETDSRSTRASRHVLRKEITAQVILSQQPRYQWNKAIVIRHFEISKIK